MDDNDFVAANDNGENETRKWGYVMVFGSIGLVCGFFFLAAFIRDKFESSLADGIVGAAAPLLGLG